MFNQIDYTMVIVSDMQRSVAFYRDTLGLPLKFESPEWTEFATGVTTLALHGGGTPKEYQDTGDQSKTAGSCSLGFNVSDLDKTYEELKGKGMPFVMPPSDRTEQGIRLAVGLDPDGLPISFAQYVGHNGE
jgi:lactoylglutathione lyase